MGLCQFDPSLSVLPIQTSDEIRLHPIGVEQVTAYFIVTSKLQVPNGRHLGTPGGM